MRNISPPKKFDFAKEGDLYECVIRNSFGTVVKRATYRLEKKYPYMARLVDFNGEATCFNIGDFEMGVLVKKSE